MANYLNIIGEYFPAAEAYISGAGDPTVYGDIQWVTAPIAQGTLDAYDGQEGDTLNSAIVVNEQSFANRQVPIYDDTAGQWKNRTSGKLFRHNTAPQTFGATIVTIFMDTNVRTDASLYTYAPLPLGEITVLEDGWYDITFDVTCDATGNSRQISEHAIFIDGTPVTGSYANGYHRSSAAGRGTASGNVLVQLTANNKIQIRSRSITGGNLTTIVGGCRIRIEATG